MRLSKFDTIELEGFHPTNPITGETITAVNHIFQVTRDLDGEIIPADALHPRQDRDASVGQIRRLNMALVR